MSSLRLRPRDDISTEGQHIFECSTSKRASSVLSYDQLRAFETLKLTSMSEVARL